jgi:hypothetical protein
MKNETPKESKLVIDFYMLSCTLKQHRSNRFFLWIVEPFNSYDNLNDSCQSKLLFYYEQNGLLVKHITQLHVSIKILCFYLFWFFLGESHKTK